MFKRFLILTAGLILMLSPVSAGAFDRSIGLILNGRQVAVEPGPFLYNDRVFVPARFVAENMGARVEWDSENSTVIISGQGDSYLKGDLVDPGAGSGIMRNLIKPAELRDILDEDKDGEMADYRQGKNGGDKIQNDPLVVDIRKEAEYNQAHVPGSVWIAEAEYMAEGQSVDKLKSLMSEHVARGGKNEVVLYCHNGNTSALAAGVLGAQGLPVKSMMYGFDMGWIGTKFAESAIKANYEDASGKTLECAG